MLWLARLANIRQAVLRGLARLNDIRRAVFRGLARLDDIRQAVLQGLARLAKEEFGKFYANLIWPPSFVFLGFKLSQLNPLSVVSQRFWANVFDLEGLTITFIF